MSTPIAALSNLAGSDYLPGGTPAEYQGSIEAFNQVFGAAGVFHPGTPKQRIAELTGKTPKPKLSRDLTPQQEEMMRRLYPDAFAPR